MARSRGTTSVAPKARPTTAGRLARAQRVRRRAEFLEIQASRFKVWTPHSLILVVGSRVGSGPRLGVTASRRVGNAVHRNRAKRLVREAFRATRDRLWTLDVDVVVVVRRIEREMKSTDLVREWLELRTRIQQQMDRAVRAVSDA